MTEITYTYDELYEAINWFKKNLKNDLSEHSVHIDESLTECPDKIFEDERYSQLAIELIKEYRFHKHGGSSDL